MGPVMLDTHAMRHADPGDTIKSRLQVQGGLSGPRPYSGTLDAITQVRCGHNDHRSCAVRGSHRARCVVICTADRNPISEKHLTWGCHWWCVQVARKEGFRGFYRGFPAVAVSVIQSAAVIHGPHACWRFLAARGAHCPSCPCLHLGRSHLTSACSIFPYFCS
jgi:hypothetical protein